MQPSEKPLNLPATFVPSQRATVLRSRLLAVSSVWRDHLNTQPNILKRLSRGSLSYARSPINLSGAAGTNKVSNVISTNVTSCGEALPTDTARERPARSATAMIFEPLPRLVFPTPAPLFRDDKRAIDETLAQVEFSSLP